MRGKAYLNPMGLGFCALRLAASPKPLMMMSASKPCAATFCRSFSSFHKQHPYSLRSLSQPGLNDVTSPMSRYFSTTPYQSTDMQQKLGPLPGVPGSLSQNALKINPVLYAASPGPELGPNYEDINTQGGGRPKESKYFIVRWFRRHPVIGTLIISPFIMGITLFVLLLIILLHDTTTYDEQSLSNINVPVNPLVLHPRRGGKKNLPIAEFLMDDSEDEEQRKIASQEKLVIIGGGWGGVGIVKHLKKGDYHVTIVSPENYFLFQPLLPSATVGTVEFRSIVEPLRRIISKIRGHYLYGYAVDVDFDNKLVEIQSVNSEESFYLPYDRLVIGCGSVNALHGVPGLEKAYQLKTIKDALTLRHQIHANLEEAALPSTPLEKRERLLSFVVSGGGPTGVEFASELVDVINEDVYKYLPKAVCQAVNVTVIQSRDHILNTYSEIISDYAEKKFKDSGINVITNARVDGITDDSVLYHLKNENVIRELPAGLVLWSTGIAKNKFADAVAAHLPEQQHKRALLVDNHLRVIGTEPGTVYALGDCSTVATRLDSKLPKYMSEVTGSADTQVLTPGQVNQLSQKIIRRYPALAYEFPRAIKKMLASNDKPWVTRDQFENLCNKLCQKLTSYPATAQVANQQGSYLGRKLSRFARARDLNLVSNTPQSDEDETLYHAFVYRHLGSLAYIGNSAVFSMDDKSGLAGGLMAMYLWRSIYWSEQVSTRNRILVLFDWIKRGIWGRDFSTF